MIGIQEAQYGFHSRMGEHILMVINWRSSSVKNVWHMSRGSFKSMIYSQPDLVMLVNNSALLTINEIVNTVTVNLRIVLLPSYIAKIRICIMTYLKR